MPGNDDFKIFEGPTEEEALKKGLSALGVAKEDVEVKLIEAGSKGILGLLAKPFRVGIRLKAEKTPETGGRKEYDFSSSSQQAPPPPKKEPEKIVVEKEERAAAVDASYTIALLQDGLYITTFRKQGAGKSLDSRTIIEELKRSGLRIFDEDVIVNLIKSNIEGAPVKFSGPPPQNFKLTRDCVVKIQIDKPKMTATVDIDPPFNGGADVTEAMIKEAIDNAGIKIQPIAEEIEKIVHNKIYETPTAIVKGVEPKPPVDGYIKWHHDLSSEKIEISIDDTGSVDYHKLLKITTVDVGEILCEKVDPVPGTDGYNVFYEPIQPKPPKVMAIVPGKNTELIDDGATLKSMISGQLIIKGNSASVVPVYEVRGDVDYSTGNIEFNGSVIVHGSILDGFHVKAEGNVEVKQTVNAAMIEAKGDVILKEGFIGREKGLIRSKSTVAAKFIQGGTIYAEGNIVIEKNIMHSSVTSGGSIYVKSKKATIVGGHLFAADVVESEFIGSPVGTKTIIEVGVEIIKEEEAARIEEEIRQTSEFIKKLQATLGALKLARERNPEGFSKAQEEILFKTEFTHKTLDAKLVELSDQKHELYDQIASNNRGKVIATGSFFPGVFISVRKQFKYDVKDAIRCSALGVQENEVRILAI